MQEPDLHLNTLKAKLKELQKKTNYKLSAAAMTAPRKTNTNKNENRAETTANSNYGGPIQRTVWNLNSNEIH